MADFNVRADAVDVEQIMQQIRARIREKRGVDYTEEQIQELAKVRLEKFLDPKGVRSDLLEQFRQTADLNTPPTYDFDDTTLFRSGNPLVAFTRRLLRPILKLFFSPNPLIQALHAQSRINRYLLERSARDVLFYEVIHNLVLEMTRTGIEVKNMQMRVESIASRLDFNERRGRALEGVVQYKPEATGDRGRPAAGGREGGGRSEAPAAPSGTDPVTGGESLRSRRKRRRRGRRSGPGFPSDERPATSDELEHRTTGDEPERRTSSAEPERPASSDAPERRAPDSHPPIQAPDADPDRS